ncbi:hypothetical protein BU24DRAFT_342753 [Aaosphaeria arxii CBS 175.79]|uniref:Zn(2)-C6 fungal-type domain-containing protein n=1 Tax=Aaosphaeria arxii CBS 175.79 TaxID=1450172 RepID=A0A6A5Y301_9PLEO|nr:uncharacterized protein BU24DRAFT_342753 [Aaosphaeria arxii CBS 175.79]KAF2019808.1 hypothetical protein BU24DRAFT_342753 [Aaosphaeria arxii CBS 175.79]
MEETEAPNLERATGQIRTVQACQRCRSLKTKCLPSERPGTCRRCFSAKRDCQWAEAPRRTKRVRGPSRISQVEQKIDGLVASLGKRDSERPIDVSDLTTNPPAGQHPKPGIFPGSWVPFPSSFSVDNNEPEKEDTRPEKDADPANQLIERLRLIHSFSNDTDSSRPPDNMFQSSSRNEAPISNEILRQLLSTGEADTLLNEFRTMSDSFPFMPIAPTTTAFELSATKPMLFHAIMLVSTPKDHKRQMALDEAYRSELANRTIIHPRRTLSLVQSLLVYLAWYHFIFSHKTQQIFSLLQLTIGLALDIGLHQKSKRMPIELPGRIVPPLPSDEVQRERQRSLLGLYYLSSTVAMGMLKPHFLKYSDYMAESCKRLRRDLEYPSDECLHRILSLRRIDDQMYDALHSEEALDLPIGDSRIAMNLRYLSTQLEEWKRENGETDSNGLREMSYDFSELQLYAVCLRSGKQVSQAASFDPQQMNAFFKCLEAAKRFLDTLLDVPVSDYYRFTMPLWMRLPYVIITASRLCIPNDANRAAQWDVKAAQDRLRLDLYLESLSHRMQLLTTYDGIIQKHHDFWCAMRMIMDLTRSWYCNKTRGSRDNASLSSSSNNLSTPETMTSSNHEHTAPASGTPSSFGTMGVSMPPMTSMGMDAAGEDTFSGSSDPFAFMHEMDFDMDQFFDIGIWGHEAYEGMGFGGHS